MISKRDWIFILIANVVSIAFAIVSAIAHLGWKAASVSVVVELVMLGWYCLRHPEPLFAKLFVFG